jgi:hypothetical protein
VSISAGVNVISEPAAVSVMDSPCFVAATWSLIRNAKDRGCTHQGSDAPGYWSEVHHVDEWAAGGAINVDKLTFSCKAHHKLIEMGWRTRKLPDGSTEWIPPPQLGLPAGTNDYHHPERLFDNDDKAC